jgi:hypothetical protein
MSWLQARQIEGEATTHHDARQPVRERGQVTRRAVQQVAAARGRRRAARVSAAGVSAGSLPRNRRARGRAASTHLALGPPLAQLPAVRLPSSGHASASGNSSAVASAVSNTAVVSDAAAAATAAAYSSSGKPTLVGAPMAPTTTRLGDAESRRVVPIILRGPAC